ANVTEDQGQWRGPRHVLETVRKGQAGRGRPLYRGIRPAEGKGPRAKGQSKAGPGGAAMLGTSRRGRVVPAAAGAPAGAGAGGWCCCHGRSGGTARAAASAARSAGTT